MQEYIFSGARVPNYAKIWPKVPVIAFFRRLLFISFEMTYLTNICKRWVCVSNFFRVNQIVLCYGRDDL
jgi:hypothetical protein